jgi:hypothetical protein
MPGSSEEAVVAAYLFLKAKQDRAVRQKKKLKKLDKKVKKLKQFQKR